jgi:RNA polymerase sigma-70 factor (ECF subfamily)
VDDAVQESFIRVWKHLAEYDGRAKFTTWLHTIVTRLCYDRIRASTRRTFFFRRFEPDEDPADDSALTESRRAESSDLAERIVQLAHRLPPQQRTVFVLRDVQDRSIEEIAEELSMTANAVRVNLCYARKRIRQMMKTEGE